jgi:kumamolisin
MNAAEPDRIPVPGSGRKSLAGASPVSPVNPDEQLRVTLLLRRRGGAERPEPRSGMSPVSRSDFAALYGADPEDISKVTDFAAAYGLQVTGVQAAARTVSLTGSAAAFSAAFQVELRHYEVNGEDYRGREGVVTVPANLDGIVIGVFGLDDRPQSRPGVVWKISQDNADTAVTRSFTPPQVAQLYKFPADVTGKGQCIAILEFGGGYQSADINHFFEGLHADAPTIVSVGVDNSDNSFGSAIEPEPEDIEVALDIEIACAVAPGSKIAAYFAPNSSQGFIDAITTAVHDATNNPSVISLSWSSPEDEWTDQSRAAIDEVFGDAALLGITVFVAAGDHGSAGRPPIVTNAMGASVSNLAYDGIAHVNFPASSPHAIACGGTHLTDNGTTISAEIVWNDGNGSATGGGISDFFDLPSWQTNAKIPHSVNVPGTRVGRGVPDVSGKADIAAGYQIYFNGKTAVVGGTSAVAPLWSGLCALLNEASGRNLGFLNTALYTDAGRAALHNIINGTNAISAIKGQKATAGYQAGSGWNACTGLGTPDGTALRALFAAHK